MSALTSSGSDAWSSATHSCSSPTGRGPMRDHVDANTSTPTRRRDEASGPFLETGLRPTPHREVTPPLHEQRVVHSPILTAFVRGLLQAQQPLLRTFDERLGRARPQQRQFAARGPDLVDAHLDPRGGEAVAKEAHPVHAPLGPLAEQGIPGAARGGWVRLGCTLGGVQSSGPAYLLEPKPDALASGDSPSAHCRHSSSTSSTGLPSAFSTARLTSSGIRTLSSSVLSLYSRSSQSSGWRASSQTVNHHDLVCASARKLKSRSRATCTSGQSS